MDDRASATMVWIAVAIAGAYFFDVLGLLIGGLVGFAAAPAIVESFNIKPLQGLAARPV
jgi:hypothetical protein